MASATKKEIPMKAALSILLVFLVASFGFCQDTEKDKIRELEKQREFQKELKINARLDSAIQLSENGQYEEADLKYRNVLATIKSVPSDLTYHFGRNSYHLQKYKQSVDWLTKYIQLKGTTGQYSLDAANWLKLAEEGLLQQRLAQSAKAVEVLSRDFVIDCGSSGKVTCPVCNGSTVVIRRTYLGEKYSTCGFCKQLGVLSCEEYNQLLRGQLKESAEEK